MVERNGSQTGQRCQTGQRARGGGAAVQAGGSRTCLALEQHFMSRHRWQHVSSPIPRCLERASPRSEQVCMRDSATLYRCPLVRWKFDGRRWVLPGGTSRRHYLHLDPRWVHGTPCRKSDMVKALHSTLFQTDNASFHILFWKNIGRTNIYMMFGEQVDAWAPPFAATIPTKLCAHI